MCSVDDVLGQSLDEVIRQGLLDPLVPYLTSTSASNAITGGSGVAGSISNANSNVTSAGGGTSDKTLSGGQSRSAASVVVSGCSAAESSSKEEEERDLSRAPSVNRHVHVKKPVYKISDLWKLIADLKKKIWKKTLI